MARFMRTHNTLLKTFTKTFRNTSDLPFHPPHCKMESVFAVPELLESILLQLDMTTLLVFASRVSRTWHHVINTSPSIQRAIYFRPIERNESYQQLLEFGLDCSKLSHWDAEFSGGEPTWSILNPLLVRKFGPCFFDFGPTYGFCRRASSFYKLPWTRRTPQEARDAWEPVGMDARMAQSERDARRPFTRRGASWRRMLISQPPPPKLGYVWMDLGLELEETNTIFTGLWVPESQEPPSVGLRMGALYDLVQYHAGHHSRYSLWFRVLCGPPKTPLCSELCEKARRELLTETHLVVELYNHQDSGWRHNRQLPADVDVFDSIFRSDERNHIKVQTESRIAKHGFWELWGWDTMAAIWEPSPPEPW